MKFTYKIRIIKMLECVSHYQSGKLTLILTHWPLLWNTGQFFSNRLENDITKIYTIYCLHMLWRSVLEEPGIYPLDFTDFRCDNAGQFFYLNLIIYFLYYGYCVFAAIINFFHNTGFRCETRVSFFIILKDCPTKTAFSIRFYHTTLF